MYGLEVDQVLAQFDVDADNGLTASQVSDRRAEHGPNSITAEKPPSLGVVALGQLRDPMNLMLVGVSIVSFVIDQTSTGIMVGLLVVLNVSLGSRQEMKALMQRSDGPAIHVQPRRCSP